MWEHFLSIGGCATEQKNLRYQSLYTVILHFIITSFLHISKFFPRRYIPKYQLYLGQIKPANSSGDNCSQESCTPVTSWWYETLCLLAQVFMNVIMNLGKEITFLPCPFPDWTFCSFRSLLLKIRFSDYYRICCTLIQCESKGREGGEVLCPWVAAEINRVTQVQVVMEFGLAQQWQRWALMSRLPLIEVWIMSNEGELGWIKNTAPGIFANSLSATCLFGHRSALIWWNTLRINPWGHLW